MSAISAQIGGLPLTLRGTAPETDPGALPPGSASWAFGGIAQQIFVQNTGGVPLRMYWKDSDLTADTNYLQIAASAEILLPAAIEVFRAAGVGGTCTFAVTAFMRHARRRA